MAKPSDVYALSGIGNLLTVGFQLYRSRFSAYFQQAILAFLWLVVPLWGWAKHCVIMTAIAQSALQDLAHQPSDLPALKRSLQPKKWHLLLMQLWSMVRIAFIAFLSFVVITIVIVVAERLFNNRITTEDPRSPISLLIGGLVLVDLYVVSLWACTFSFFAEVTAATEQQFQPFRALRRTRELLQGAFWPAFGLVLMTFFVTFPTSFATLWLVSRILRGLLIVLPIAASAKLTLHTVAVLGVGCFTVILTLPLWQTVKATLYYYLRNQQEGTDLALRSP